MNRKHQTRIKTTQQFIQPPPLVSLQNRHNMSLVLILLNTTVQIKDSTLERALDCQKAYQGGKRLYSKYENSKKDLQENTPVGSRDQNLSFGARSQIYKISETQNDY